MSTPVRPMATTSYAASSLWTCRSAVLSTSDPHPGVLGREGQQVVVAGPDVGHRALVVVLGRTGQDGVLLEDVPPGIPGVLQGPHDGGDVDVALTEGHVHAAGHAVGVGHLPCLHPARHVQPDVLEVDVGDPARV